MSLFIYLSIFLSIYLAIHLSTHPSISLSAHLEINLKNKNFEIPVLFSLEVEVYNSEIVIDEKKIKTKFIKT